MNERLPALKPRQVLAALERAGFIVHHTTGSHYGVRHRTDYRLRVTVPMHNQRSQARNAPLDPPTSRNRDRGFLKLL